MAEEPGRGLSIRRDVIEAQREGHSLQRYNVLSTIAGHIAHPLLVRLPRGQTVRCAEVLRADRGPLAGDAAGEDPALDEATKRARLGAAPGASAAATVATLPQAELERLLAAWGVEPGSADPAEARRCLEKAVSVDFWRHNFEVHPQRRRVRNWIWVHDRYRHQAAELLRRCRAWAQLGVAVDEGEEGEGGAGLSAEAVGELRRLFISFARKIDGHHRFEETILFPTLREQPDPAATEPTTTGLSGVRDPGERERLESALEENLEPQHELITGPLVRAPRRVPPSDRFRRWLTACAVVQSTHRWWPALMRSLRYAPRRRESTGWMRRGSGSRTGTVRGRGRAWAAEGPPPPPRSPPRPSHFQQRRQQTAVTSDGWMRWRGCVRSCRSTSACCRSTWWRRRGRFCTAGC